MSLGKGIAVHHQSAYRAAAQIVRKGFQKTFDPVFLVFHQQYICGFCDGIEKQGRKHGLIFRFGVQEQMTQTMGKSILPQLRQ